MEKPAHLADDQMRWLRLRAQQLVDRRPGSTAAVAQLTATLGAVQAQEAAAAGLALRARCQGLAASHVQQARLEDRSVVRTWCLRGTLHLVAAEDLGWLLALVGPHLIQAGRRRRAELGLDAETGARGVRALVELLDERGPLTRAEIREALATRGIATTGQATYHLLQLAGLEGCVCLGPDRGREPLFVKLADWIHLGPARAPDQAAAELARRYVAAYGPADPKDFAAWSGLPAGQVRAAWQHLASEFLEIVHHGSPVWLSAGQSAWLDERPARGSVVRLVPGYDPYLLGYRTRRLAVSPQHARAVHPGGGMLHPAILVDGRATGTWRVRWQHGRLMVAAEPFDDLADVRHELDAEIDAVLGFMER